MKKITSIFVLSFIAVMVSVDARAELVSNGLLNTRLGTDGNLGTLAIKSTVTSDEIVDGTITDADISASAGIAQSKLSTEVQAILNAVEGKATTAALNTEATTRQNADTTLQANIDKKQDKLKTGEGGNITGSGSVTVSVDNESGKVTISGTDNNTVTTATTTGDGNVVSAITATNGALTVTKGINAVTRASAAAVGDTTHAVYVDANGAVQKVDKVAAAASADSATTATNARKVPYGGENANTFVGIWVE